MFSAMNPLKDNILSIDDVSSTKLGSDVMHM